MRIILQTEAAECGVACLAMIASAHGQHTDLFELRKRFQLSRKGATLKQLTDYAACLGFACRPLRLDIEEVSELACPSILHWGLNHFVVLEKVSRRDVTIIDPAVGRRRLKLYELSRNFTGAAIELAPTTEFKTQKPSRRISLSALTGRTTGLWRSLLQVFALAAVLERRFQA